MITIPSKRKQSRYIDIKEFKASEYTVNLLVKLILRFALHLQMLLRNCWISETDPPPILSSGAKSPCADNP